MTELDWKTASEDDVERLFLKDGNAGLRVEQEAGLLADRAHRSHPDYGRMQTERTAFARRLVNVSRARRYLIACEMRAHFEGRCAEAQAIADADAKAGFERALAAQRGPLLEAHRQKWVERNGAGLRRIAEKLRGLAQAIETETGAAADHERLKQILDDTERQLGVIRGQDVSAEHKVIRAALAEAKAAEQKDAA